MANVRFYKLEFLPDFEAKYNGIFVHVTKTMYKEKWPLSDGKEKDPSTIYMTPEKKVGESVGRINLVEWLSTRHITEIASGLWFGGENGWELLSNETTDAAINNKIDTLNAGGFTQATIGANPEGSESATDSILTIKGIKELKGKIEQDDTKNFVVAIDGVYDESNNKIATQSTVTTAVTTAIEGLDSEGTIQAVTTAPAEGNTANTVLTFNGVKEVDGKILQGDGATTLTVGDAKLKIQIGSSTAFDVFSANAQANSTIQLDGFVFKKDDNNVISVITPTAVSSSNRLVTEQDVANLSGAMHYKGAITSANSSTPDNWPSTVAAGDVYIATGNFVKDGNTIESGDLIVFNSATLTDYKVVQSNITLGIDNGQIAANVGALTNGNLVVGVNDPQSGKKGIKTVEFDVTNLTGTTGKNERNLKIENGTADTLVASLYHDVTITDDFTVIGKPFTKSINISSTNRSIEIAQNGSTGVVVDLVWNTSIE